MTDFRPGLVIPVGAGRMENLLAVIRSISVQGAMVPDDGVIVLDGSEVSQEFSATHELHELLKGLPFHVTVLDTPKHIPGAEQPRNIGVRHLSLCTDCTHVWFLDSDVLAPFALGEFAAAHALVDLDRILIGPYDWMPEGHREPMPDLLNDMRWPAFREAEPEYVSRGKLNDGLACFSGNLVWPIAEFIRIGGFWNELHHGRCEDGELGLHAVAEDVPISFAPRARGWHMGHPINHALIEQRNARDVPMLNARHPWMEGHGVFMVERDGRRFEQRCEHCGEVVNTLDWWQHVEDHRQQRQEPAA